MEIMEMAGNDFGAAIVVRHVECIEARLGIGLHLARQRQRIECASILLHVGDLPKAGEDAADLEIGCECDAIGAMGHVLSRGLCSDPYRMSGGCKRELLSLFQSLATGLAGAPGSLYGDRKS